MNITALTPKELLELAYTTTETKILEILADKESMFLRRAVARNRSTPSFVINRLVKDPVLNVSFMACRHQNCTTTKNFTDELHHCVTCEKDERYMDCSHCNL